MTSPAEGRFWAQTAPAWVADEARREQIGGPLGRDAMAALDLKPGQRVLDIGCGTGSTTVEIASRVRPGGVAVGIDITAELLGHAERREPAASVEFICGDAQTADLGNQRFDAAYSRFGVMFFADPVAAFSNIRRALRPGGRLGFVCWQALEANEWMSIPAAAIAAATHTPLPAPQPGDPGSFSLADANVTRRILTAAGFVDIRVIARNDPLLIPAAAIDSFVDGAVERGHGPVQQSLARTDASTRAAVRAAVTDALTASVRDGHARLSRGAYLVVARPAERSATGRAGPRSRRSDQAG